MVATESPRKTQKKVNRQDAKDAKKFKGNKPSHGENRVLGDGCVAPATARLLSSNFLGVLGVLAVDSLLWLSV